jgi:hypothetical protein
LCLDGFGRDHPPASVSYQSEQIIDLGGIELLGAARPALIPAVRAYRDGPAFMAAGRLPSQGRRLDLNAKQAIVDLRDQVDIGTVPKRNPHQRALARQPLHCRELAKVALNAAVDRSLSAVRGSLCLNLMHEQMFPYISDRKLRYL